MRKKIIKAWVVALPLLMLSFSWYTYADDDFDCTSLDMDTMEEIKEKIDNWEDLTDDETEIMENAQTCGWPQWGMWGWSMWEEEEDSEMWNRPEMWEDGEEWEMWDRPAMWEDNEELDSEEVDEDKGNGLSTKMQTAIGNAVDWIKETYSDLDDDDQIEIYETIIEKLETKLESVSDSDDMDEDQQELLENILEELISQLEDLVDNLED